MGKKFLAYLLSLCMLLTLLPAAAFAADEDKAQVVGGAGYSTARMTGLQGTTPLTTRGL